MQWVTSWPTEESRLADAEFTEVFTTSLGRESVAVRAMAGRSIAGRGVSDAYGLQLNRERLPGADDTICHDAIGACLMDLVEAGGIRVVREPRGIFASLVPVGVLMRPGRPPDIVPDAAMDVSMPEAVTVRGQHQSRTRLPARRLLFDVKTIFGGGVLYQSARARDEQSGAVAERAHAVHGAYVRHAQDMDRRYSPAGQTPVEQRLMSFTPVRALVIGQYGEASPDVHSLLEVAAQQRAARMWRCMGARSQEEFYSFTVASYRRRLGMVAVREMARHRLARVPYVGAPRAAVDAAVAARRLQSIRARGGVEVPIVPRWEPAEAFFAMQAHMIQRPEVRT